MLTIYFQMLSAACLLEYSMAPKSMDYLFILSSIVSQQKPSTSRRLFQHIFIYTNIQLSIQQIKKYLLCAKNCAKFWEHNGEQNKAWSLLLWSLQGDRGNTHKSIKEISL